MQMKIPDYMPKVIIKLANCNLSFVSGPFSHWNSLLCRMSNFEVRVDVFDILRSQVIILEENVLVLIKFNQIRNSTGLTQFSESALMTLSRP